MFLIELQLDFNTTQSNKSYHWSPVHGENMSSGEIEILQSELHTMLSLVINFHS